jgi:peroxiredoxin
MGWAGPKRIENFTLDDYRGKQVSLADAGGAKAHVILVLGAECPLVGMYAVRMNQLAERWTAQGVRFLAINSNRQDSLAEIAAQAQRLGFTFPVLKDSDQQVADALGAVRTPQAFVLNANNEICYGGRIDDQFGVGYQKPNPTRRDLEIAIEEVLAGKPVAVANTDVQGCLIGRKQKVEPTGDVTYSNQIARIFQRRCVECHHDNQVAPFALTTFEESVGWADMIHEVVESRRMPPWLADPKHHEFNNNPSLSEEEKQLIFTWIDNGCPEGDPKDLPKPIEFAKGWTMSQPDQVFYMSDQSFTVPAEGVVDYQYYRVDPGNKENLWIKEAEVRAGNPAVVHHVIVFIQRPDVRMIQPQMAYAPGMPPRKLPPGRAIKIPAGSQLVFQVHYTPNGLEQSDRSYVGFKYADPKDVTHEVVGKAAGVMLFAIPPNDPNFKMVGVETIRRETTLIGMNPHMHLRGKSFKYELVHPDGRTELLLDVPRYDFNWQLWYNLTEPKVLPAGSKVVCTAHFDNSSENLSNPNPNATVRWGEQTSDEMMFGFFSTERPITSSEPIDDPGLGQGH